MNSQERLASSSYALVLLALLAAAVTVFRAPASPSSAPAAAPQAGAAELGTR